VPAVLIVAASDLTSELGRTVLWRSGVERAFARDPQAGFEAARSLAPRLVVVAAADAQEAASFVRRLREDPETRPTAIAVLSQSAEDDEPLRQAGANVVLPGQVDPSLWDTRLEELLSIPPRLEARIPVRLQAWFTGFVTGTEAIEAVTLNLSVRGALLETSAPLEVGSKLDMSLRLPGEDGEVKVVGQVVREEEGSEGRVRSAVKFLVLRDDARKRIRAFVDSGLQPPRKPRSAATALELPEQQEWERELRDSEARKAAILDCALDAVITMDSEGRATEFSRAAERMFGLERAQVIGKTIADTIVPPALRERHRRGLARYLATGEARILGRRVEVTGLRADGTEFPLELSIATTQADGQRIFTAYLRDISDQKRAELGQAVQHATTRVLAEAPTLADAAPRILQAICESLRWDVGALWTVDASADALRCAEIWPAPPAFPGFRAMARSRALRRGAGLLGRVWALGKPVWSTRMSGDTDFVRSEAAEKDGLHGAVVFPILLGGDCLGVMEFLSRDDRPGDDDLLERFATIGSQIGQYMARKRADEEIKRNVSLLQSSIESTADGLLVVDRQGGLVTFNQRFAQLWRIPAVLLKSKDDTAILDHAVAQLKSPEQFLGKIRELREQPEAEAFDVLEFKDGRVFERYSIPQRQDGTPVGRVWSFRDVTERTLAEQALRQTEKLAAMGSLLAGVAHELNNPLSVILGQAEMLRRTAGSGPLAQKADQIAEAAGRCASIVGNFLALARQRPPERRRVDLNEIVREVVDIVSYPLRMDGVDVVLDLDPELPIVVGDPHQLHQVALNLMTNAQDAMRGREGPRMLVVATSFDEVAKRVSLEVSDTGPGIPDAVRSRLFEPFFTTKPPGQGTGLGLSLCQGIVENHGGRISAESEEGKGALFRVELPLELRRDADAEAGAPAGPKGGKILVVDDEAHVAGVLAEMLAVDGHRIDVAQNGALALDRLRQGSYDLVLSDIRMPELDGLGLYEEVRRLHPEMARRFVFLTGDRLSSETGKFLATAGAPSLGKPFHLDEVLSVVRRMLQAR